MNVIEIYSAGIVHLSVCALKTIPVNCVEDFANAEHPTGISSRWNLSEDETFASGEQHPKECEDDSSRIHYLMVC